MDGVNIDWGLAGQPVDAVGKFQNAFEVGRALAGKQIAGNAMTSYMADPTAPIDPRLGAANPELAVQLQNRQGDAKVQAELKDDKAFKVIKEGLKEGDKVIMKPAEELSDDEMKALVAHMRGFKK